MAYLDYYRSNPNWATSQWQSVAPPAPSFQPQPSWGGMDFYRAIAGQNYDGGIYNYASNRLQGLGTQSSSTMGPSIVEAKLLHRRAYGGLGDILTMAPTEIGAAAAYEVWRNWRYNYGTLAQPLGGDTIRQREALVGLAVGEATKLWQHTTRAYDNTGCLAAVEAAAIAAARIFDQGNSLLMSSGGAYGTAGAGMRGGMGMGALSPAIPTGGMGAGMGGFAGTAMSPHIAAQGTGMAPTLSGLSAPPFTRQRSLSMGAAPPDYAYGAGGVPSYAGSNTGKMYGGADGMPSYGGSNAGMYGGADGMLGAGTAGMGMARPLSAGGYGSAGGIQYGNPADYGPGGPGETAISRHERHRAERAALKDALRRDRAYDDNYAYEYGRGGYADGYGSDYGDGHGYSSGYGGYGSHRPRYGRHGRRQHRATRAAEDFALGAADAFDAGNGDRYGYGHGGRHGGGHY